MRNLICRIIAASHSSPHIYLFPHSFQLFHVLRFSSNYGMLDCCRPSRVRNAIKDLEESDVYSNLWRLCVNAIMRNLICRIIAASHSSPHIYLFPHSFQLQWNVGLSSRFCKSNLCKKQWFCINKQGYEQEIVINKQQRNTWKH